MAAPFTLPQATLDVVRRHFAPSEHTVWANDPEAWWHDQAEPHDVFLWSIQLELLAALVRSPQVAAKSCHSAGKTFLAATAAAWWIDAHPPGEAFVVTTAPTGDQVKATVWREIGRLHRRLGLAGRTNLTEWYVDNEIVGIGRSPNDYDPTSFQGIHARYVLVIIDEACGVAGGIWDAASSLASNRNGRILAIGNPDDPGAHFAKICGLDTWETLRISAFDTPNFTDEEVPEYLRDLLISPEWVERKAQEWGVDSPMYQARVLGEFPQDASDGVIPMSWASQCRYLDLPLDPHADVELGVDPAAEGTDNAVCWARQGRKALRKWAWPYTPDPRGLALLIVDVINETGATTVKIDAEGLGWGVSGILDEMHIAGRHNAISVPIMSKVAADDEAHFFNRKAELWWSGRERSRLEQWDLSELDDDDIADLTVPRYHTKNPRARIQVESKAELRTRLGRSPDSGDGLLLAFHEANVAPVLLVDEVAQARI